MLDTMKLEKIAALLNDEVGEAILSLISTYIHCGHYEEEFVFAIEKEIKEWQEWAKTQEIVVRERVVKYKELKR